MAQLDPNLADRFADLALAGVQREYPNQIAHVLLSDADIGTPRQLHPAFFGCYDWHSAVHSHWCLARLLRKFPAAAWASSARAVLQQHLAPENIAEEAAYLAAPGRAGFERPYGLAWLLQLAAELQSATAQAAGAELAAHLAPLTALARDQMCVWLPKLTHPIRSGEHSQTAFALGLALDYARTVGDTEFAQLLADRSLDFYKHDAGWPLRFEPSGHDFLSPGLAEADLLRRLLDPGAYAAWLTQFLPDLPADGNDSWLVPVLSVDRADGKLAHLDGLNLSRAWMLERIAMGLPASDRRIAALRAAADRHRHAGLAAVTGEHYAGGHWLASFAVYLHE